MKLIVYAIQNKYGEYFNRVHRDFRPLCQNTLFVMNKNQARRVMRETFAFSGKNLDEYIVAPLVISEYEGRY